MDSASVCSRRSSCSTCPTCMPRSLPQARSAMASISCSSRSSVASCIGRASNGKSDMAENLSRKTAVELASLIATKAVSPVEVLDAHLATIARVNPKLNAIVTLVADAARALAKDAEAAVMRADTLGGLHGLPVAIKDITPTAGIRTTYGSPLFKDNVPAAADRKSTHLNSSHS